MHKKTSLKYLSKHQQQCKQLGTSGRAVFIMVCFFSFVSERHDINNKEQVEQIQKIYVDALMEYIEKKRFHSGTCLAKLLVRLSDLRSISIEHSKMLKMMHMNESLMPHIVQDIYIQSC